MTPGTYGMRGLLKWPLRIVGLVVLGLVAYLVVSVVQVLTASQVSQLPSAVSPAAMIVVISPPGGSAKLTTDITNRLEQALTLYQARRAPIVAVTGSSTPADHSGPLATTGLPAATTELGAEIRFLEQQGLPQAHIYEAYGASDPAALAAVAKVVGHEDGGRVILVADPLSSLRLRATASSKGLVPEISPASPPSRAFWTDVGEVWRQALALAEGRVLGFGSTGWASA